MMLELAQAVSLNGQNIALGALGAIAAVAIAIVLIAFVLVPGFKLFGRCLGRLGRFIGSEVGDSLRLVGALLTAIVFIPLTVLNVFIGRWSASAHYGRAIEGEAKAFGAALYRLVVGNPARLFGLGALTEGFEKRVPQVVAAAPSADAPAWGGSGRAGQFEGWEIVGSLQGGGSGGKLYIAKPTLQKTAGLARQGIGDIDRVVIKSFSLRDGSTLPQIIRESRALPAAKRLGLIVEHELTNERFFYITRYVPGDSLALVTQRMHAASTAGGAGLDAAGLRSALSNTADLLRTLSTYHAGGLWHKDVKPDNVIVSQGRAHLVDFGLITPLRSSMTLTTHGTEYFRDPEMVRMALRGAKVHEVDGARFDIYAVGAVLYAMIENSFPAHGGLSQITKQCPEAVRWIVRRAMTDYDKRYETSGIMLGDVEAVLAAADAYAIKPAALPSLRAMGDGAAAAAMASVNGAASVAAHPWEADGPVAAAAGNSMAAPAGVPTASTAGSSGAGGAAGVAATPGATTMGRGLPRFRVANWWTGEYVVEHHAGSGLPMDSALATAGASMGAGSPRPRPVDRGPRIGGSTAAEQLVRARARMQSRRERAQARIAGRRAQFEPAGVNAGVVIAVVAAIALVSVAALFIGVGGWFVLTPPSPGASSAPVSSQASDQPPPADESPDGAWIVGRPDADTYAWKKVHASLDPSASHVSVLVLRDPGSYDAASRVEVDEQLRRVADANFALLGEHGLSSAEPAADVTKQMELVADLRREIGVQTLGSAGARAAIVSWLGRNTEAQVVTWVGRGEDGTTQAWCVAGSGADTLQLKELSRLLAGETAEPAPKNNPVKKRGR